MPSASVVSRPGTVSVLTTATSVPSRSVVVRVSTDMIPGERLSVAITSP
jgi:hypothetical protein